MTRPRLSAKGKPRQRPVRTLDVNRVMSRYQAPDIHVSPVQLDDAGAGVRTSLLICDRHRTLPDIGVSLRVEVWVTSNPWKGCPTGSG